MRGALVIVLAAASVSARGWADNVPHREGEYSGVTPGQTPHDPAARPSRPARPPPRGTLTWIGFEAKERGAEVFFQSVAPFEVSQRVEGTHVVVHLSLTRLGHNTWRQIDTRFFDNPLSGIVARTVGAARATRDRPGHGAGIEARIAFKNPKDVKEGTVRSATEADGMYYAYVRFPEGSDPPGTTAAPEPVEPREPRPNVPARPARPVRAAPPAKKPKQ